MMNLRQVMEAGACAAFAIANQYQDLSYFAHALEVLLHNILEAEDDRSRNGTTGVIEPLPAVLSFMQAHPATSSAAATIPKRSRLIVGPPSCG